MPILPSHNFTDPIMHERVSYDDKDCVCAIKLVFHDFGAVAVSVIGIVKTVFGLSEVVAKAFWENISGLVYRNKIMEANLVFVCEYQYD